MIPLKIQQNNIEISRKILNSVSHSYDCGVEWFVDGDHLVYSGDEKCAQEIMRQATEMFEHE